MYRTITPIAVLGAALVLAVPAAFGKGQLPEPQWKQALEVRSEALNRHHGLGEYDPAIRAIELRSEALNKAHRLGAYSMTSAKPDVQRTTRVYPDVFERAVMARGSVDSTFDRFVANDRAHNVQPTNRPTVSATGSDDEIRWPQIGIGFGVGIALALGLMVALRGTRQRPLAH